jgi:hypothetical protein
MIGLALVLAGCGSAYPEPPSGLVFPTDPDRSAPIVAPLDEVASGSDTLEGRTFTVSTCADHGCESAVPLAHADADGQFLLEPDPDADSDPAAEVNAYFHLAAWRAQLNHWGLTPPEFDARVDYAPDGDGDGDGDPIRTALRFDTPRPTLLLGRWYGRRAAYDPDMVRVGLTRLALGEPPSPVRSAYGLDFTAAQLYIASSDYLVASATGDPALGEYLGVASGQSQLSSTESDGVWPDDALGEPFRDAPLWSSALWRLRGVLGAEAADALAVSVARARPLDAPTAIATLVAQAPGAAASITDVISLLGLDRPPLRIFSDRGSIPLWIPAADLPAVTPDGTAVPPGVRPAALQLAVDVPADATHLALSALPLPGQPVAVADLRLAVRVGEPVLFAEPPQPSADTVVLEVPDGRATFEIPVSANAPSQRIYIAVEHRGSGSGFLWLSAAID